MKAVTKAVSFFLRVRLKGLFLKLSMNSTFSWMLFTKVVVKPTEKLESESPKSEVFHIDSTIKSIVRPHWKLSPARLSVEKCERNFDNPNTQFDSTQFGTIFSADGTERQLQFALKFIF